nr:unnamed protein product [Spirometra erinaceieuropaei]
MTDVKEDKCYIKDLKPNMKRVSAVFIVLDVGSPTRTKDGNEVRTVKVADRTGCINLSVWNEKGALIAPCDTLQLLQGNTTVRNGCLTLNVGRFGQLIKFGEFCFPFVEQPDYSAYNEEWAKLLDQPQSKKPSEPDCLSYLMPTKDSDEPLPPPKSVADELQRRTLELLLLWDQEMTSGVCKSLTSSQSIAWTPSPRVRGQLSALMRYLRTSSVGDTATPCLVPRRLRDIGARIAELERTRLAEEAQRQRSASTADAIIRRHLLGLRNSYLDSKQAIEENLTSLRSVLDLLIRDPFDDFGGQGEEDANVTEPGVVDPREHGILFSSSSGFGASYASETVPVSLDVAAHQDTSQLGLLPKMHVSLTEEVRVLRDSGQEFVNLATRYHRPVLCDYIQMAHLCSSSPGLADALSEQSEAQNMLTRLDRLTHLFADAIVFEESTDANTADAPEETTSVHHKKSMKEGEVEEDDDDDDDSDFLEVPPLVDAGLQKPLVSPPSLDPDEKLLTDQVVYVTEKLPWELETTQSDRPRTFYSSNSRARRLKKLSGVVGSY